MPVRQRALAAYRELRAEKPDLRGRGRHVDFAVQAAHLPGADAEAVIAEPWRPSSFTEVRKVCRRRECLVIVIARRRARALQMSSPGRLIAAAVILQPAGWIRVVAEREKLTWNGIEE